jgi:hypothetical protein
MIVGNIKDSSDLTDKRALAMRLLQIEVENQEEIGRRFSAMESPYVPPEIPAQQKSLTQVEQDETELVNRLVSGLTKTGVKDSVARESVNGFLSGEVGTIQDIVNLIRSIPEIKKRFKSLSPEDIDSDHLIRIMGYVARDYLSTNGFAFDKNGKLAVSYNDLTRLLPDTKSMQNLRAKLKKVEVEMRKGSRAQSLEMNLLINAIKKLDLTEKVLKDIGQILPSTSEIGKAKKKKVSETGEVLDAEEVEERNLAIEDFKTIIESGVVYTRDEVVKAIGDIPDGRISDYAEFVRILNTLGAKPIDNVKLANASEDLKSNFLVKDYKIVAPEMLEELVPTLGNAVSRSEYQGYYDEEDEGVDYIFSALKGKQPSKFSEAEIDIIDPLDKVAYFDYSNLPEYVEKMMEEVNVFLVNDFEEIIYYFNSFKSKNIKKLIKSVMIELNSNPENFIDVNEDTDLWAKLYDLILFREIWVFLNNERKRQVSSYKERGVLSEGETRLVEAEIEEEEANRILGSKLMADIEVVNEIEKILSRIKLIYGNYLKKEVKGVVKFISPEEAEYLRQYVRTRGNARPKDWLKYIDYVNNVIEGNTTPEGRPIGSDINDFRSLSKKYPWALNLSDRAGEIGAPKLVADKAVELAGFDRKYAPYDNPRTQLYSKIGLGTGGTKKPPFNASTFKPRRIKIGKGVMVEDEPKYSRFGKWVVHQKQLRDSDKLNLRYPSMAYIPSLRPTTVSPDYKDVLLDLIEANKLNERKYERLSQAEKAHFTKVMEGSGLSTKFKFKGVGAINTTNDEDRFNLLMGELKAGNNNRKMIAELKSLVKGFILEGRIDQKEGYGILTDLDKI